MTEKPTSWMLATAMLLIVVACGGSSPAEEDAGEGEASAPAREEQAGPFVPVGVVTPGASQTALTVSSEGDHLYSGSFAADPGAGLILRYEVAEGRLSDGSPVSDIGGIEGVQELLLFSEGERLLAISTGAGVTGSPSVLFERDVGTGELTPLTELGIGGFHSSAISPDGRHLYTVPPRENALGIWERAGEDGAYREREEMNLGLTAPNESSTSQLLAMGPEGRFLYATTNKKYDENRERLASHRLYVYARDPETGSLEEIEFHEDDEGGVELPQPKSLAVSPDGTRVLVGVSTFSGGGISIFSRNDQSGTVTYETMAMLETGEFLAGETMTGRVSPEAIAVAPDSAHFFVAASDTNAIVTYAFR